LQTIDFLRKICPAAGGYFIDTPFRTGKGFRHYYAKSLDEAVYYINMLESQNATVYFACASFSGETLIRSDGKKVHRTQDNVHAVRSFWLDLDVDANDPKKFSSQTDALQKLVHFCNDTGLPFPLCVNSGYGVHCYWPLDRDILPGVWKDTANKLKALAGHLDFGQGDTTRTADSASVLRPTGTFNRKATEEPRPVGLIRDAGPFTFDSILGAIENALAKHGVALPKVFTRHLSEAEKLNEQFEVQQNYEASNAEAVATSCQQIRLFRDRPNELSEPVWYAGIQLLLHTVEADQVVHAWSSGHRGYSPEETSRKIIQLKPFGPTLCDTFKSRNPEACVGCKFAGKITSPIQLGVIVKALPAPVLELESPTEPVLPIIGDAPAILPAVVAATIEIPNPPAPFTRAATGLFMDVEGIPIKFHDYDLYPYELIQSEKGGEFIAKIRAFLPKTGWRDFSMPVSVLEDQKQTMALFRNNSILPTDKKRLILYVDAYLRSLQAQAGESRSFASMGWKDGFESFVLGKHEISRGGVFKAAKVTQRAAAATDGIDAAGDYTEWSRNTAFLDDESLRAHAFSLLTGFASPLFALTALPGVTCAMLGEGGDGKTTMARMALSIFGNPDKLAMPTKSTTNARMERMGVYSNLLCYVDEITQIKADELHDFIYLIAGGQGPERLDKNAVSKGIAEWKTIMLTSTNDSLIERVSANKVASRPILMRLFEYEVRRPEQFIPHLKHLSVHVAPVHYGMVGRIYMKWVMENLNTVRGMIDKLQDSIMAAISKDGQERFWVALIATAIAGGIIAKHLGLIQFDPMKVLTWAIQTAKQKQAEAHASQTDEITLLGEYLNATAPNRLVLGVDSGLGGANQPMQARVRTPAAHAELLSRWELENKVLFVDRANFKAYLAKRGASYTKMKKVLTASKILMREEPKVLGAYVPGYGGAQIRAWLFDLNHPVFADMVEAIVAPVEEKK
jgi:hypothetical protein